MANIVIKNITTSPATTTLLSKGSQFGKIRSISIANFSDNAADARVDIFWKEDVNDYYLIKNAMIPKGGTLLLDDGYEFSGKSLKLMAYSVATAAALTIIIQPENTVLR